jgi:hypothetical protein
MHVHSTYATERIPGSFCRGPLGLTGARMCILFPFISDRCHICPYDLVTNYCKGFGAPAGDESSGALV